MQSPLVPAGDAAHDWLWLIPALPLAASALCGVLHYVEARKRLPKVAHGHGHDQHHGHDTHAHDTHAHDDHGHGHEKVPAGLAGLAPIVAIAAMLVAFGLSLKGFFELRDGTATVLRATSWSWIDTGTFPIDLTMHLDRLSSLMTLVVTGIGTLIFVYASGYMKGDKGYGKFFAYLSLFAFSMLMLVLSSSLIGFWYEKGWPADAGQKAFVMNRVGDACFLIGSFLLAKTFLTLDMAMIAADTASKLPELGPKLFLAGLFLFLGACGKSAQMPLFTWLPDAMAGPTPVSALIHAATMVTAGIYLVVRLNPVFASSPELLQIIGVVGVLTAFIAGSTALVQRDIKKVLAYSTVSQLGYMFVGLASGAWAAAVFHLVTHAFFKALLFLGAGSVIHGMHEEQDMHKMGGLKKHMPATFVTFMCGAAALSGLPLLSGFFSKDEILAHTFAQGGLYMGIWVLGVATAALTAFYTWRMVALTFYGKERFDAHKVHPHESPIIMTLPLMVLAILSVFGGVLGLPPVFHVAHNLKEWLAPVTAAGDAILAQRGAHEVSHAVEWALLGLGSVIAIVFATMGFKKHVLGTQADEAFATKRSGLHAFLTDAWTIDTKYTHWIVQPVKLLAFVIAVVFDQFAIDGLVNGVASFARGLGERTRRMANGRIASYGLWMGAVAAVLVLVLIWNR